MESKKKKEGLDSQAIQDIAKRKTVEKFYQQVVKNFGYEYQRSVQG